MRRPVQLDYRTQTPEETLAVLADVQRVLTESGDTDTRDVETSIDLTIAEWCAACGMDPGADDLAKVLSDLLDVALPKEALKELVSTPEETRLLELCSALAPQTTVLDLKPAHVFGVDCLSAGVFFAVRQLLAEAGANVDRLRPSTRIDNHLYRHPEAFVTIRRHMCPAKTDLVSWTPPGSVGCGLIWGIGFVAWLVGIILWVMGSHGASGLFQLATLLTHAAAGGMIVLSWFLRGTYELEGIRDFRDLCRAILASPQPPTRLVPIP